MKRISILLMTLLGFTSSVSGDSHNATAVFAGGCFWCMEADFEKREGVTGVVSGFTGGKLENPTYSGDHSGHFEAIEITYDPDVVSYPQLLTQFWTSIDPFDNKGQFCDKGYSYRAAIFAGNDTELQLAQESLEELAARFPGQKIHTEVRMASTFWPVEEYHQDYYSKNPLRYKYYRWNCGRDQRLEALWGSELKD